jgi:hypothetical protein
MNVDIPKKLLTQIENRCEGFPARVTRRKTPLADRSKQL